MKRLRDRVTPLLGLSPLVFCACNGIDADQTWALNESRTGLADGARLDLPVDETRFAVFVPRGVRRVDLALVATESLALGPNSQVLEPVLDPKDLKFAMVASAGTMRIGPNAQVGSVYALGSSPLDLETGAFVHGYVKTAALRSWSEDAHVEVGVLEHAPRAFEEFEWAVDAPGTDPGDRRSRTEDGPVLDVSPGAYRNVVLDAGSTMRLRAGTYTIDRLDVRPTATLAIDNTSGPVYVWIRHSAAFGGAIIDDSLEPNVMFGFAGTSAPSITTPFRGTLVAPRADVSLPATAEPHRGSFFARRITLADRASVEHRAFVIASSELPSLPRTCGLCALFEAAAVRRCHDDYNRFLADAQDSDDRCVALCAHFVGEASRACSANCTSEMADESHRLRSALATCIEEDAAAKLHACEHKAGFRAGTCLTHGLLLPRSPGDP